MRLSDVQVEGLFDTFQHDVSLNLKDRITIIYGPNGIGKTTLLKLIDSLFRGQFTYLKKTRFRSFRLHFDDGKTLEIRQRGTRDSLADTRQRSLPTLLFSASQGTSSLGSFKMAPLSLRDSDIRINASFIERRIESLERVGEEEWLDHQTDEILEFEEVLDRYSEQLPVDPRTRQIPDWLAKLIGSVRVHFIQTQRLLAFDDSPQLRTRHRPRMAATVVTYSSGMASTIQRNLAESAAISQQLDRTFPNRLLRPKRGRTPADTTIRTKYREQGERQRRLIEAGLSRAQQDLPPLPGRALTPQDRKILGPYLADMDKKLKVFDDLLPKIELLRDIINTSFRYKTLKIDAREGFIFETQEGTRVLPTDLSSGEQHELVLTYELLFGIKSESLILIDEPELSLHVTWQHKFLKDLARISDLVNLDFLVATHSPQIIHKRWDLAVSLED